MCADVSDDPADEDAFRAAMAGVQRHSGSNRLVSRPPPPPPRPRSREADDRAVLEELRHAPLDHETMESGDTLIYRAAGIQDSVWRRLRRGGYRVGAELDLHGLNRNHAQQAVHQFLARCQDRGIRCVRIIHGKGLGSPNTGPVIKSLLDSWLRRRRDVLAFCSARPQDGGTGAIYVLLRAASPAPGTAI
jgi:DNA-nicking Smr family endonuclease